MKQKMGDVIALYVDSALLSICRITPTDKNMETIKGLKNTEKDTNILDFIKNMEELFK
jgi:hypothetical protein